MGHFNSQFKGRAWVATIQIANMINAGIPKEIYENPEQLADILTSLWNDSGKNRTSGVAVCVSASGLYHAHMALYGNTTTLKNVADILYGSHIEPQLGGKKELSSYLRKEGIYAEKGEHVLFTKNIDAVQDVQGHRHDLDIIQQLLSDGCTPNQIFRENIRYRKYANLIKEAYLDKRITDTPIIKTMHNEYHVGASKSGKTWYYTQLCESLGRDNIYMLNDLQNGGLDLYIASGAPSVLFIDDFKGTNINFSILLNMLDQYSDLQTHSRYQNTYNLWNKVIITSIYPLEVVYKILVDPDHQKTDDFFQLLRRFEVIVYHYVTNTGEYKTFSLPASEYIDYDNLQKRALNNMENGFIPLPQYEKKLFDD